MVDIIDIDQIIRDRYKKRLDENKLITRIYLRLGLDNENNKYFNTIKKEITEYVANKYKNNYCYCCGKYRFSSKYACHVDKHIKYCSDCRYLVLCPVRFRKGKVTMSVCIRHASSLRKNQIISKWRTALEDYFYDCIQFIIVSYL